MSGIPRSGLPRRVSATTGSSSSSSLTHSDALSSDMKQTSAAPPAAPRSSAIPTMRGGGGAEKKDVVPKPVEKPSPAKRASISSSSPSTSAKKDKPARSQSVVVSSPSTAAQTSASAELTPITSRGDGTSTTLQSVFEPAPPQGVSASAAAVADEPKPSNPNTPSAHPSRPFFASPSISPTHSFFLASSTTLSNSPASGTLISDASESDNIKVCVRIRPLVRDEREELISWCWDENRIYSVPTSRRVGSTSYAEHNPSTQGNYAFDYLFDPESNNEQIFDQVAKSIVLSAMNGYHGSVFCYGQTSTGKTYTMNGCTAQPGVIAQAVDLCFETINQYPEREFLFRVSYLEVYNEQVKDLLSTDPHTQIKIQFDPKQGTVISGAKEQVVLTPQQVLALIRAGEAHRHVGSTDMNEKSSRAHTLFRITIESKDRNNNTTPVRVSTLNLVDLAGSESAKLTNTKGERAREARFINQSLLTLSLIIHRLSEDRSVGGAAKKTQHLPYRDSKLTRLLESALDGNARIAIVCTVSPAVRCAEETNNTLKFAARAKMIKMSAKINETMDDKTLLRAYREEIEQLRTRLREMEARNALRDAQQASLLAQAAILPQTIKGEKAEELKELEEKSLAGKNALAGSSAASVSSLSDSDVKADEERNTMLQMIAEMERLILRADGHKTQPKKQPKPATTPRGGLRKEISMSPRPMSAKKPPLTSSKSMFNVLGGVPQLERANSKGFVDDIALGSATERMGAPPPLSQPSQRIEHLSIDTTQPSEGHSALASLTEQSADTDKLSDLPLQTPHRQPSLSMGGLYEVYHRLEQSADRMGISVPQHGGVAQGDLSALRVPLPTPLRRVQSSKKVLFDDGETSPVPGQSQTQQAQGQEDDSVLLSVSTMLMMLKGFIAQHKGAHRLSDAGSDHADHHDHDSATAHGPAPFASASISAAATASSGHGETVPRALYEQLKVDLKLKAADNRFLQEELENKDKMLNMLTDGLKEVENTQMQWLTANQELSGELERAYRVNELLHNEVQRLTHLLYGDPDSSADTAAEPGLGGTQSPMFSPFSPATPDADGDFEGVVDTPLADIDVVREHGLAFSPEAARFAASPLAPAKAQVDQLLPVTPAAGLVTSSPSSAITVAAVPSTVANPQLMPSTPARSPGAQAFASPTPLRHLAGASASLTPMAFSPAALEAVVTSPMAPGIHTADDVKAQSDEQPDAQVHSVPETNAQAEEKAQVDEEVRVKEQVQLEEPMHAEEQARVDEQAQVEEPVHVEEQAQLEEPMHVEEQAQLEVQATAEQDAEQVDAQRQAEEQKWTLDPSLSATSLDEEQRVASQAALEEVLAGAKLVEEADEEDEHAYATARCTPTPGSL